MGEGTWDARPSLAGGQRVHSIPLSLMWPVQGPGRAGQEEGDRAIWALTGQQQIKVKTVKPPPKVQIPRGEEQEEEEPSAGGREPGWGGGQGSGSAVLHSVSRVSSAAVASPPPAQGVKKPLTRGGARAVPKAEAELAQEAEPDGGAPQAQGRGVGPSSEPPRVPSREIRNIIRMYQSRPGPVPVPVQPSRWARGPAALPTPPGGNLRTPDLCLLSGSPPKVS